MNKTRRCPALAADTPAEIKDAFEFLWEMAVFADSAVNREKKVLPPGREAREPPPPMTDEERRREIATLLLAFADFLERINLGDAGGLCQDMADALRDLNRGHTPPLLTKTDTAGKNEDGKSRGGRPKGKANDEGGHYYAAIAIERKVKDFEAARGGIEKRGDIKAACRETLKALKVKSVTLGQLIDWHKKVRARFEDDLAKLWFEGEVAGTSYDDALSKARWHLKQAGERPSLRVKKYALMLR